MGCPNCARLEEIGWLAIVVLHDERRWNDEARASERAAHAVAARTHEAATRRAAQAELVAADRDARIVALEDEKRRAFAAGYKVLESLAEERAAREKAERERDEAWAVADTTCECGCDKLMHESRARRSCTACACWGFVRDAARARIVELEAQVERMRSAMSAASVPVPVASSDTLIQSTWAELNAVPPTCPQCRWYAWEPVLGPWVGGHHPRCSTRASDLAGLAARESGREGER